MDNDIKIIDKKELSQTHKDVMLFLDDELNLLQKENAISSYNLDEEYAKTKKNKSLFSFFILTGCLIVVLLVSWGLKKNIDTKNENITINLEEFDNLNLKGLLDSVFKVQGNYDNAIKEKSRIISQKELELQDAQTKLDNELFLIDSLKLSSKKEIARRKTQAEDEYKKTVEGINLKYDEQIAAIEAEANEYKLQLAEYDTAKIESAKEQEKSRSGITTPNRHLFLLLFIFTFNLRSVQEHHQQCSILKDLDVVQRFQHEVRIHLRQRFCPTGVFYELLCSITFQ